MSYSLAQTPLHHKKPPKSPARNHQNSALILINCSEYSPSHLGIGQKLQTGQEVTSIKNNDYEEKNRVIWICTENKLKNNKRLLGMIQYWYQYLISALILGLNALLVLVKYVPMPVFCVCIWKCCSRNYVFVLLWHVRQFVYVLENTCWGKLFKEQTFVGGGGEGSGGGVRMPLVLGIAECQNARTLTGSVCDIDVWCL